MEELSANNSTSNSFSSQGSGSTKRTPSFGSTAQIQKLTASLRKQKKEFTNEILRRPSIFPTKQNTKRIPSSFLEMPPGSHKDAEEQRQANRSSMILGAEKEDTLEFDFFNKQQLQTSNADNGDSSGSTGSEHGRTAGNTDELLLTIRDSKDDEGVTGEIYPITLKESFIKKNNEKGLQSELPTTTAVGNNVTNAGKNNDFAAAKYSPEQNEETSSQSRKISSTQFSSAQDDDTGRPSRESAATADVVSLFRGLLGNNTEQQKDSFILSPPKKIEGPQLSLINHSKSSITKAETKKSKIDSPRKVDFPPKKIDSPALNTRRRKSLVPTPSPNQRGKTKISRIDSGGDLSFLSGFDDVSSDYSTLVSSPSTTKSDILVDDSPARNTRSRKKGLSASRVFTQTDIGKRKSPGTPKSLSSMSSPSPSKKNERSRKRRDTADTQTLQEILGDIIADENTRTTISPNNANRSMAEKERPPKSPVLDKNKNSSTLDRTKYQTVQGGESGEECYEYHSMMSFGSSSNTEDHERTYTDGTMILDSSISTNGDSRKTSMGISIDSVTEFQELESRVMKSDNNSTVNTSTSTSFSTKDKSVMEKENIVPGGTFSSGRELESGENITRTPSPIFKGSDAKDESSTDKKRKIKNRKSTPISRIGIKLSRSDVSKDDNMEITTASSVASTNNYQLTNQVNPSSDKKQVPKSILNSNRKRQRRPTELSETTPSKQVAFGSPTAAEFNLGSPSVSITPMPSKTVKAMFVIPEDIDTNSNSILSGDTAMREEGQHVFQNENEKQLTDNNQTQTIELEKNLRDIIDDANYDCNASSERTALSDNGTEQLERNIKDLFSENRNEHGQPINKYQKAIEKQKQRMPLEEHTVGLEDDISLMLKKAKEEVSDFDISEPTSPLVNSGTNMSQNSSIVDSSSKFSVLMSNSLGHDKENKHHNMTEDEPFQAKKLDFDKNEREVCEDEHGQSSFKSTSHPKLYNRHSLSFGNASYCSTIVDSDTNHTIFNPSNDGSHTIELESGIDSLFKAVDNKQRNIERQSNANKEKGPLNTSNDNETNTLELDGDIGSLLESLNKFDNNQIKGKRDVDDYEKKSAQSRPTITDHQDISSNSSAEDVQLSSDFTGTYTNCVSSSPSSSTKENSVSRISDVAEMSALEMDVPAFLSSPENQERNHPVCEKLRNEEKESSTRRFSLASPLKYRLSLNSNDLSKLVDDNDDVKNFDSPSRSNKLPTNDPIDLKLDEIIQASEVWPGISSQYFNPDLLLSSFKYLVENNNSFLVVKSVNKFFSDVCEEVEGNANANAVSGQQILLASEIDEFDIRSLQRIVRVDACNAQDSAHTDHSQEQLKVLGKVIREYAFDEWTLWETRVLEAFDGKLTELSSSFDVHAKNLLVNNDCINKLHDSLSVTAAKAAKKARRKSLKRRKNTVVEIKREIEALESEIRATEMFLESSKREVGCLTSIVTTKTDLDASKNEIPKELEILRQARIDATTAEGLHSWSPTEMSKSGITVSFVGGVGEKHGMKLNFIFGSDSIKCRFSYETTAARKQINVTKKSQHNAVDKYYLMRIQKMSEKQSFTLESQEAIRNTIQSYAWKIGRIDLNVKELCRLQNRHEMNLDHVKKEDKDYALVTVFFSSRCRTKKVKASFDLCDAYPFASMEVSLTVLHGSINIDDLSRQMVKSTRPGFGYLSRACDVLSTFLG